MVRKTRIHQPGELYHVMLRGNIGQPIFFNLQDRLRFLSLLQESTKKFCYRIHAICLMTNHIHIAVQVGENSLSKIIQPLAFKHAIYMNKKLERKGHLFQGRFKAILVDSDGYLMELVRYIHLNPVRANIVDDPIQYPWSGHRTYLGKEELPCLSTEWVLSQFSDNLERARIAYKKFVLAGIGQETNDVFETGNYQGRILGPDDFIQKTMERLYDNPPVKLDIHEIIKEVCTMYHLTVEDLILHSKKKRYVYARSILAFFVREYSSSSLSDLGRILKKDTSGLCRMAGKFELQSSTEESLKNDLAHLRKKLKLSVNNPPAFTPRCQV